MRRSLSIFILAVLSLPLAAQQWTPVSGALTTTSPVEINAGGGGNVDLKVTGRIRTGDGTLGGVWLNAAQTMFVGQAGASTFGFFGGGAFRLAVDRDSGHVGVGTLGPWSRLTVVDDSPGLYDATLLTLAHAEATRYQGRFRLRSLDGRPRLILGTFANGVAYEPLAVWENRVGVNTFVPAASLDIHAIAAGITRTVARIADDSPYGAGVGAGLDFAGIYVDHGATASFGNIRATKADARNGYANGVMVLSTSRDDAQLVEVMRLEAGRMNVTGDANFTGTVTGANVEARYQDVAEWVPATRDLAPGTVVVLNPAAENQVMPSHAPYDTTVAGVVSAQPGVILGVRGPDKEQIATTGRVLVRVDATQHPIAVGDLLVTGHKPGTAMYSAPFDVGGVRIHRPGTIIGKALQPLASGEGEILVLLSLQ